MHHMIEFDVEFRSYTCTCRYDIHVFGYFKSFVVAKKKKIIWHGV